MADKFLGKIFDLEGYGDGMYQGAYHYIFLKLIFLMTVANLIFSGVYFYFGMQNLALSGLGVSIGCISCLVFYKHSGKYLTSVNIFAFLIHTILAYQHSAHDARFQLTLSWAPIMHLGIVIFSGANNSKFSALWGVLMMVGAEVISKTPTFNKVTYSDSQLFVLNVMGILLTAGTAYYIGLIVVRAFNKVIEDMKEQKDHLFQVNESNSALVSLLTHDIGNPLGVASNLLRFIRMGQLEEREVEELSRRMDDNLVRIKEVIENVKTIKATKDGKIRIKLSPVSIKDVIYKSIESFSDDLKKKNLEVRVNESKIDSQKTYIWADEVSLHNSVLNNILSNAIKFSKPSSVIEINLVEKEELVEVYIRDYGIGMPKHIMETLFDPTASTSRMGTSGEKGTGFGMPIVKMFIERYGANVSIQSWEENSSQVYRCGTEFKLSFKKKVKERIGTLMSA